MTGMGESEDGEGVPVATRDVSEPKASTFVLVSTTGSFFVVLDVSPETSADVTEDNFSTVIDLVVEMTEFCTSEHGCVSVKDFSVHSYFWSEFDRS